jgi:hypothetical protein
MHGSFLIEAVLVGIARQGIHVCFWHEADQLDWPLLRQQLTHSGHFLSG